MTLFRSGGRQQIFTFVLPLLELGNLNKPHFAGWLIMGHVAWESYFKCNIAMVCVQTKPESFNCEMTTASSRPIVEYS